MTQTTVTFADAPRDLDGILKLGRFQMRLLADEVPAYSNGDEKQAFLKMDSPGQAAAIYKAVQERDKREKGGGGGSSSKTTTAKPAVSRTPSNKGATKENVESPASTGGGDVGSNTAALFALLKELKDGQTDLEAKIDALTESQDTIQGQIAGNNKLVSVGISLALQMSEQVLNASAEQVLTLAIEQLPNIEETLNNLVGGGDEGNDGGEGNE